MVEYSLLESLRSLKPKRQLREGRPILEVLHEVTPAQWAQLFIGWLAWMCDAIDYFSVPLSLTDLSAQFGQTTNSVTTAITLTLLLRSVGAVVFGMISDRFGRKWPLVCNLLLCAVLELGASFVKTWSEFLAMRALFGIAMGGVWGLSAATALENLPVEVRGLASGIVQLGYSSGNLLAAAIYLKLVPETTHRWQFLFWVASAYSLIAAGIRAFIPESQIFLRAREMRKTRDAGTWQMSKVFLREVMTMLRRHWLLSIYAIFLMTGFNFFTHGSQDLYKTYLEISKNMSAAEAIEATIIGSFGAITGSVVAGFASQYVGRRLTIAVFVLIAAAFIPLWVVSSSFTALAAGAFLVQFGVMGAYGVIPIHLAEISPPAFRASFTGITYQIGNMVAAGPSQIETDSKRWKKTVMKDGVVTVVPDYSNVLGILMGVVSVYVLILTVIGPENHASHFENAKVGYEEGAGHDEFEDGDEHDGGEEFAPRQGTASMIALDGRSLIPHMHHAREELSPGRATASMVNHDGESFNPYAEHTEV